MQKGTSEKDGSKIDPETVIFKEGRFGEKNTEGVGNIRSLYYVLCLHCQRDGMGFQKIFLTVEYMKKFFIGLLKTTLLGIAAFFAVRLVYILIDFAFGWNLSA